VDQSKYHPKSYKYLKSLIELRIVSQIFNSCCRSFATPAVFTGSSLIFSTSCAVLAKMNTRMFQHPLAATMPYAWIDGIVVTCVLSSLYSLVYSISNDIIARGFKRSERYRSDKSFNRRVKGTMALRIYMTNSYFCRMLPLVITENSLSNAISLCMLSQ